METVLSGIRSTGNLHLGNYLGALRNFVRMQRDYRCYFFIADLHSLTTHPRPDDLHGNVRRILAQYLAAGIDPEVSTLYIQSDIPEIPELYLLLNMIAHAGELERTATFKDKIRLQPGNINAGLLTYPVLMAADILIHRANKVPVGKDQEQHLEHTRLLARRFNSLYRCEIFPEPVAFNFGEKLIRVPGLDGSGKMGKSEGNGLFLVEDPKSVRKKVMSAVTDAGAVPGQPMSEPVRNLFTILALVSGADTVKYFEEQHAAGTIRYGDLKKQLAEDIIDFMAPVREKYQTIESDGAYLRKVAAAGREKARESALVTMRLVRSAIGFRSF